MFKKTVVALFFAILIGVFVGFSLLLLQKQDTDTNIEMLTRQQAAKDQQITDQFEEIGGYKDQLNDLSAQIVGLGQAINDKDLAIAELEENQQEQEASLSARWDLINKLKQCLDVSLVGQLAREWVEYIDNGEFGEAYARCSKAIDSSVSSFVLSEFRVYYSRHIGRARIKMLDVVTRGIPDSVTNDLVVGMVLDIITPNRLAQAYEIIDERHAAAEEAAAAVAAAIAEEEANRAGQVGEPGSEEGSDDLTDPPEAHDPSAAPDPSEALGPTATPNPSAAPNPSDAPDPSEALGLTATSNPSAAPDPSDPQDPTISQETPDEEPADGGKQEGEGEGEEEEEFVPLVTEEELWMVALDPDIEFSDDLEESIFVNGENQLFFLMNYKKEVNDWEIMKIVQYLS